MQFSSPSRRWHWLAASFLLFALITGSGCTDPIGTRSRFETIPSTDEAIHDAIMVALRQTLTVNGSCKSPYFINCSDSIPDSPFQVDLTPVALTLTRAPQTDGSFSHAGTLRVRTRRDIGVTLGGAACRLSLLSDSTDPHIVAGGTALRVEPTEAKPYTWIYLFTEMMTGLEPGMVHITGGAACDQPFDPHLLSVLIGELIPKQLAICKPEGEQYSLCPAS